MNSYWYNRLVDVLRVQTNSENEKLMVLYLDKELGLLKLDYTIDAAGNVLVTKGKVGTYPCVVSHMDTVHSFVDNFEIYHDIKDKDILFAMNDKQRVGIGGDDKCGIFGCLYLLKTVPNIKVIFFSREESGCRGSGAINMKFFEDCRYLIQLDRRGSKDFIQTYWSKKTVSHEFSSEIGLTKKKWGYKNATGTVTDVMKLWDNKVGVSCVNLSCGYYKAHSAEEYISVATLWRSIKFVEEIISTMKPKRYPSLPPPPVVVKTTYTGYWKTNKLQCSRCYKYKQEALLYVLSTDYHEMAGKKVCWSCKEKLKKGGTKGLSPTTKPAQNEIIVLACSECGIKPENMRKGQKLKRVNGNLYCDDCRAIFFVSDKPPKECYMCNRVIPKDHKIIERFGIRVCEDCALPSDLEIIES